MSVSASLNNKAGLLTGNIASAIEIERLRTTLPEDVLPTWFLSLIGDYRLSGTCFSLDDDDDLSELGVDLKWLTPDQIVDEALSAHPGKKVIDLGYLPVGACLTGSGDPYFLKLKDKTEDPPLVRIPHELSGANNYPEEEIETVSDSLSIFFRQASID